MRPSPQQIADLFSVIFEKSPDVNALPRKTKGANADESVELGSQCLNEGDYEKAIDHFKRAIEQRNATNPGDHVDLAGAYEFAEMAPQALRQYEKALRVRQDSAESRLGMSQLYKRNARYKDSLKHLEEAINVEPMNPFYRFKMAEILREIGDKEGALTSAQLAVAAAPEDSFYHYWVGDLLIEMKRYTDALESLRAAVELSPGDDFLYLKAAAAFWGAERRQEAIKSIRLAGDLDPDKKLYNGILEALLNEMGLEEEAALESKSASQMDDYDREALKRFLIEIGEIVPL